MTSNAKRSRCDWQQQGGSCQFVTLSPPEIQLPCNTILCPLHTPCGISARNQHDVIGLLNAAVEKGIHNFDGVHFPDDRDVRISAKDDVIVSFRDCVFGRNASLDLRGVSSKAKVVLAGPKMRGSLIVHLPPGHFDASGSDFKQKLSVSPLDAKLAHYGFREVRFRRTFEVTGRMAGVWDLSDAEFFDIVILHRGSSTGPVVAAGATVNFFGASFKRQSCPPKAEGHYREYREDFAKISDRDNESLFYLLEKRSQRFGLPFGINRTTSALYDYISAYGSSYVRPLILMLAVQAIAGVWYACSSTQFEQSVEGIVTIVGFTLAQAAKPFELLGVRPPSGVIQSVAGDRPSAFWALGTFAHSIISLTFFALFLLALRWRFKRN